MRTPMVLLLILAAGCADGMGGEANVKTMAVEYQHGDVVLEGFLARPAEGEGPWPGVLVCHAWKGVGPHERETAVRLAKAGCVALCADIYGKGIRPATSEEAGKQAGIYRADRALLRARARAGLEELRRQPGVDPERVAAIGYCFGGGTVLELARSGAELAGVVSFHGNLDTPDPADAKNIRAKALVFHGAADPHVPPEQVAAFVREMEAAKVDWQLVQYGGAVHSFTDPDAGSDPSTGAAYDERAATRSWRAMEDFFAEVL